MVERIRIIVGGLVQGVVFRASARSKAVELGITGWVMNRDDGRVEIIAEGGKTEIEEFKRWSQIGPPSAVVEEVEITNLTGQREYSDFTIKF
ncbi:MAG: acylphosphatase [Thermodesulfobacteriota bacterium]